MSFLEDANKHFQKKTQIYETEIESKFVTYARSRGCRAEKLVLLNGRGFPDRPVFCPGGRIFFIEFKRKNKKLSKTQKEVRKWLVDLGFKYYVCDEIGQAEEILDGVLNADMSIL